MSIESKISGIYKIVNTVNGKKYVGSAVDIKRRWQAHKLRLRKNNHHSPKLQNAWNKHGESSFTFSDSLFALALADSLILVRASSDTGGLFLWASDIRAAPFMRRL